MSMNQETWLERNTFHHGAFWDLIKLVEEKEKKRTENLSLHPHSQ